MIKDQRGFKAIIQLEAAEFLKPRQLLLNSTVKTISYSTQGVTVTLASGLKISGDYALCTFSLGVLQHNDVDFLPIMPGNVLVKKIQLSFILHSLTRL